jgi:transcriptional regulator
VYGKLIVHEDAKWLRGVVGRLTKTFEANQAEPWKMADAPEAYIGERLQEIVGIEIPINRIVGKRKTSQNRPRVDQVGAAEGLRASGDPEDAAMAELILGSRSG